MGIFENLDRLLGVGFHRWPDIVLIITSAATAGGGGVRMMMMVMVTMVKGRLQKLTFSHISNTTLWKWSEKVF